MKTFIPLILMAAMAGDASAAPDTFLTVNDDEFEKRIASPDVYLLDVRTPDEYNAGHIDGAVNLDVTAPDFMEKAKAQLPCDKVIGVYCRSGKRSAMAATELSANGYEVVDLDGGIEGWEKAGKPVVK